MNKIRNTLGAILTAVSMAGCEPDQTETAKSYSKEPQAVEFMPEISLDKLPERTLELEGRIIKVQPSSLSYTYGTREASRSANHEFIYVVLESQDKNLHTLIYPYSKAILEKNANIKYVPFALESITTEKFIKNFISKDYHSEDKFNIEAEGFITPGGITYK